MKTTRASDENKICRRAVGSFPRRAGLVLACSWLILVALGHERSCQAGVLVSDKGRELTIDRFASALSRVEVSDLDGTFPVTDGATLTGRMIGKAFDVQLQLDGTAAPGSGLWMAIEDGRLRYHRNAGVFGRVVWHYDGNDGDWHSIHASAGLGGIDLTRGGSVDRLAVGVFSNARPVSFSVILYSSLDDGSEITTTIPATEQPGTVRLPFSDFIGSAGNGVDLTAVTAIAFALGFDGSNDEVDLVLSGIEATGDPRAPKVLRSQLRGKAETWNYAVNFPGMNPYDFEVADDFTVPIGQTWTLGGLRLAGAYVPAPPVNPAVDVTVYADDDGKPGAEVFHKAGVSLHAGSVPDIWEAVFDGPFDLSEGHYWIGFQGLVDIGTELRVYESDDFDANDPADRPYDARNPGGALAPDCPDWTTAIECNGQRFSLAIALLGPAPIETGKAYADHYESFGNVGISQPCTSGLLANDELTAGPVIGYDTPTINGATVNVTEDGGFDYIPAAAFRGEDFFTYTRQDGSSAAVHISVRCLVWAIDNDPQVASSSANTGTLTDPFVSLDAFKTDDPSQPGDIIYFLPGTYFGSLALKNGQAIASKIDAFLAESAHEADHGPLSLPTTFIPSDAAATIQSLEGDAVTLARDNLIVGIDITTAGGSFGIKGNNFGRLTLYDTSITGSSSGVDLENGSLDAKYININTFDPTAAALQWRYNLESEPPDMNAGPPHGYKHKGCGPELLLAYSNVNGPNGGVDARVFGAASATIAGFGNIITGGTGIGFGATSQDTSALSLKFTGNTVAGVLCDIWLTQEDDSTFTLPGFTGSSNEDAAKFVQENNEDDPYVFITGNITTAF